MSKITVVIKVSTAHLPVGVAFDHTDIDVKDASGATFNQAVNGKEVPAWSGSFEVADGAGSVSVTARDDQGNPIGAPLSATFDTLAGTFQAPVGVTVIVG